MDVHREEMFKKVYDFHGHICLMSTAGVRIALAAINAIGQDKSQEFLFAFYHARTCALDPIQFITGCTLGNSNIIVNDDEKSHTLELVRQKDGTGVKVTLKEEILKKMRSCMKLKREAEKEYEEDFNNVIDMLKNEDEKLIVDVTPYKMDIKPFLRF
jgi:formylmethanofuran dehydrogenase subunit E